MGCLLAVLLVGPQDDVGRLINRLSDADIAVRQRATDDLIQHGEKAAPALERALKDDDAEVRGRAAQALERIESGETDDLLGLRSRRAGRDASCEAALRRAADWLAKAQARDGSWEGTHDVGVTALGALALLGADGVGSEPAKCALAWIEKRQEKDGRIGDGEKMMYGHAIATLALCEAAALGAECKTAATRAVDWLVLARNPGKGWRYTARSGDCDSMVTSWCLLALRLAVRAGIKVPEAAFEGGRAWLDECTEENYYRVGYVHRVTKCYSIAYGEFNLHETTTASAGVCRLLSGDPHDQLRLRGALALIKRDAPLGEKCDRDFLYWHFGALFVRLEDAKAWKTWEQALLKGLLPLQTADGSWDPEDRFGAEGGRVYATALNALTLQTRYRFSIPKHAGK